MLSDTMPPEKLTEDLLARLLSASNPREYLDQGVTVDRTLAEYLHELLRERGVKRAAVIRASGIHPTVVYDIPYTGLQELFVSYSSIAQLYKKILEWGLMVSQNKADSWRFETAKERYKRFLKDFPEAAKRAPISHIASYLLMTPETLSRVRAEIFQE